MQRATAAMRGGLLWLVAAGPAIGCGDANDDDDDDGSVDDGSDDAGQATGTGATSTDDTAAEPTGASDESGEIEPPPLPEGFTPFACDEASPDVTVDRLCDEAADPEGAPDEIDIQCRLEGSCLASPPPSATESLVVMTYNVERGVHMDEQLTLFGDVLPMPDVLLLVEADRGCARSGERNVAWEYAQALEMNHVYGVEFIELPRPGDQITEICEHGNAVLSRYPIGNVSLHRHETNLSWWGSVDEPRLGGRMAVLADIAVGQRLVHVQVLHFESGIGDGEIRAAQAVELAELGNAQPHPAIIGGDTNAGIYMLDIANGTHNDTTTEAFFERGWRDAHEAVPLRLRATRAPGLVIDLLMTKLETTDAEVCDDADCGGLSDHMAAWATFQLPPA